MQYEWKCRVCGHVTTVHRSVADIDVPPEGAETNHEPECQEKGSNDELYRIISSPSVPFEHLRDKGVFDRTHWKRGT